MHILLIGGSVILALIQLCSSWMLSQKKRLGWILSISANIFALPYDTLTTQYGFVIVSLINLIIGIRAWILWREETLRDMV